MSGLEFSRQPASVRMRLRAGTVFAATRPIVDGNMNMRQSAGRHVWDAFARRPSEWVVLCHSLISCSSQLAAKCRSRQSTKLDGTKYRAGEPRRGTISVRNASFRIFPRSQELESEELLDVQREAAAAQTAVNVGLNPAFLHQYGLQFPQQPVLPPVRPSFCHVCHAPHTPCRICRNKLLGRLLIGHCLSPRMLSRPRCSPHFRFQQRCGADNFHPAAFAAGGPAHGRPLACRRVS